MRMHEGPHSADNPFPDCFGCKVAGGINVSPSATPSQRSKALPRTPDPAWQRGREGEFRPDGSFMPILNDRGLPMGVKEAQDNRAKVDAGRKRLKSDPHVFAHRS